MKSTTLRRHLTARRPDKRGFRTKKPGNIAKTEDGGAEKSRSERKISRGIVLNRPRIAKSKEPAHDCRRSYRTNRC